MEVMASRVMSSTVYLARALMAGGQWPSRLLTIYGGDGGDSGEDGSSASVRSMCGR
jgi:hypothetical protein